LDVSYNSLDINDSDSEAMNVINTFLNLNADVTYQPQNTTPTIDVGPTNLTANVGDTAVFTVSAMSSSEPDIYYQWYFNYAPLSDGGNILGATSNVLSVFLTNTNQAGDYYVAVSDDNGTIFSDDAYLTVTGSSTVAFPDTNLEASVVAALGLSSGPVTEAKLLTLTNLTASHDQIQDATGLQYATNLTFLDLSGNALTDISPLAGLTSLDTLYINGNNITDLSPLDGLVNLTHLQIGENAHLYDLSPLTNLTALVSFDAGFDSITNLPSLVDLTGLTEVFVDNNRIASLSPLAGMPHLSYLDAGGNLLTNISPVTTLASLATLYLDHNYIANLSPLSGMTTLTYLDVSFNDVTNLSPLAGLTELTQLNAGYNQISDISPLTNLVKLVWLPLEQNQITNLAPLAGLTNLNTLYIDNNRVTSLSPLVNLAELTTLYLNNNQIKDVSPLMGLTNLNDVNLSYNVIDILPGSTAARYIQTLQSRSATVVYLPQNIVFLLTPASGNHQFQFTISGPTGQVYQVQSSTNLSMTNWTSLGTVTNITGLLSFTNSSATNASRFYRLLEQ
jgi:internalin A